jgi:hypothetical protein
MRRAITAYVLTFFLAIAVAWFALRQWIDPMSTPDPSLINCFGYAKPLEANILYPGAIALSAAMIVSAVFRRRLAAVWAEALAGLVAGYLVVIGLRTIPTGVAGPGLAVTLGIIGCILCGALILTARLLRRLPGGHA